MEITDEEYQEYQHLKSHYHRELVIESVDNVTKLEDDIDSPIKNCVAAFALLGCEPRWSCCGFDYRGQPFHKSHDYGHVSFVLTINEKTISVLERFFQSNVFMRDSWRCIPHCQDGVNVVSFFTVVHQDKIWEDKDNIHYYELGVTHTTRLEQFLMSMSDSFSEKVTLNDTNHEYKKRFPYWQYPSKEPWTITKEWLMSNANGYRNT